MSEPVYFKVSCGSCDGHIAYPETSAGQTVACPHCSKDVLLPIQSTDPAPPRFVVEPQDGRTTEGGYVRFTAKAEGVPIPTLQWFTVDRDKTGRPLHGETKNELVIINPPLGISRYLVSATNSAAAIQSRVATLSVDSEQKIKLEPAPVLDIPRTTSKKSGFDLFQKISCREDARFMIRETGWIFLVFSLMDLVAGVFAQSFFAIAFTCAVLGAALCWFNSRIASITMLVQGCVGTGFLLLAKSLGDDENSAWSIFTVFGGGIGVLQLIITIRAIEATFKYHGRFALEKLDAKPAIGQSVAFLVVGFVALIGIAISAMTGVVHFTR